MSIRIRDAITGDIVLEDWEELCVRTPTFQRLHRIKQLGNAFHAYPSAMHTRFEHSIGVCYQIKKLFSQPGFFKFISKPDDEKLRLAYLAGLLHDITHTPFKHTLDRDVAILPPENLKDEYIYRLEKMKSEQKELGNVLNGKRAELLIDILSTEDPYDLGEPYLRQIIEDTISADLLDYSRRDAYFTTGATRPWDERIYDHIAAAPYGGKPCLVARITDEEGKIAESAITELTNLLYVRYILNERVYLYPVKIAADSLLVKSIRFLLMSGTIDHKKLRAIYKDMSDEELINYLVRKRISGVSLYADFLRDRQLPKLAHSFKTGDLTVHQEKKVDRYCRGYEDFDKWLELEERIAREAGIDPGDVIIYCHDLKMQKKKPDFLIQDDQPEPRPLKSHERMLEETEHIAKKHVNLWRCYVFSMDEDEEALKKVEKASKEILKSL